MTEVPNREFARLFPQTRDLPSPSAPLLGRISTCLAVANLANHLPKPHDEPRLFLHIGPVHVQVREYRPSQAGV